MALQRNTGNPFIVGRLAKLLTKNGKTDDAIAVYKSAIDSGFRDKQVHFGYAKLLIDQDYSDGNEIEYHLRRAFTEGDANNETQFLVRPPVVRQRKNSRRYTGFNGLKNLPLDPNIKRIVRGPLTGAEGPTRFTGRVDGLEYDYGFIIRDGTADRVFLHITNTDKTLWDSLSVNTRLSFSIGFNFLGRYGD